MNQATTANDWEEKIGDLLAELSDVQDELFDVLAEKRQRIASGQFEAAPELEERQSALSQRLTQCQQRREDLLRQAASHDMPADNIRSLASSLPNRQPRTDRMVRQTASRMALLQQECVLNWVVDQQHLVHIANMLDIYARGGRPQPVYGSKKRSSGRGALMDHQA